MLPDNFLSILKSEYPKRYGATGWTSLRRLIPQRLAEGFTWTEILEGTKAYKRYCDHTGKTGTELVKMAQTFYGRDAWFTEDYEVPETTRRTYVEREPTPEERAEEQRKWEEQMARLSNMQRPLQLVRK